MEQEPVQVRNKSRQHCNDCGYLHAGETAIQLAWRYRRTMELDRSKVLVLVPEHSMPELGCSNRSCD